jgi:hypothetical protein
MSERVKATLSTGGTIEGEPEAVARAVAIDRSMQAEERQWIADLRARGVKAAHPDDGWVDRAENKVHLCYPDFNDGLAVGDLLALGWPSRYRIVRVTATSTLRLQPQDRLPGPWYWHFEAHS